MPSGSEKEREMMAIAEHHPDQLYERNRGVLKMSHQQLHDFASGVRKGGKKKAMAAKGQAKPAGASAPLGSGERFQALEGQLSGRKGVYDAGGLAAAIGRRKYGAKKMAAMSAAGRKRG